MKEVLTIGFVATAISPYFSEEQQVRIKSENHLKKIIILSIFVALFSLLLIIFDIN